MTAYKILVLDNFHFGGESEEYTLGPYAIAEEAIVAAQKLIDETLAAECKPGMTAAALLDQWVSFGETPIIHGGDPNGSPVAFSGPAYARQRCDELTGKKLVFPPEWKDVTGEYTGQTISLIGVKPPKPIGEG